MSQRSQDDFNWNDFLDENGQQAGQTAYNSGLAPPPTPPADPPVVGGMENQPNAVAAPPASAPPPAQAATSSGGSFADKMRAVVMQKHPDWSPDQVQQQVTYYVNKNNDPSEVMGNGQKATEEYWLGRESGTIPADGGGGGQSAGTYGSMAGFSPNSSSSLASFSAPGLIAPWTQQYQPPNITDDPSYQWRLQQGQDALEKSAASKGTLLTGGTLKDLANYSQGLASTEYAAADARNFRNYQNDENTYYANQNNAFSRLSGLTGQGLNAANAGAGYGLNAAGMGLNAANSSAQYGTSYANNLSGLQTNQGNANAAGTVANSNANTGLFTSLGNIDWGSIFNKNKTGTTPPRTANGSMGGG